MAKKLFEVFYPNYRFKKEDVLLTTKELTDTKKIVNVVVFKTEDVAKTELEMLNRAFKFFYLSTSEATFGESAQVVKYDCFEEATIVSTRTVSGAFSASRLGYTHPAKRSGEENGNIVLSFETSEQAEKFAEELKFALKFCNEDAVVDTVKVFGTVVCFQKISENQTPQTDPQAS